MLTQANRLKKTSDFKKVFRSGRSAGGNLFDLRFAANNLNFCRFGFLISLKISRKAVKRNRIRRQLSEAIRCFLSRLKPGYDIVLIAKPRIIDAKSEEIIRDLKNVIEKNSLAA